MDREQYRLYIVRPILQSINLWTQAAEHLMVGTALCESNLEFLKQIDGPAVSINQIEPLTYKDLRYKLLKDYSKLADRIKATLYLDYLPDVPDYLIGNVGASMVFARLKYYFNPLPLPDSEDYEGLAKYYKRIYNTSNGAAKIEVAVRIFRSVVYDYNDTLSQRI